MHWWERCPLSRQTNPERVGQAQLKLMGGKSEAALAQLTGAETKNDINFGKTYFRRKWG